MPHWNISSKSWWVSARRLWSSNQSSWKFWTNECRLRLEFDVGWENWMWSLHYGWRNITVWCLYKSVSDSHFEAIEIEGVSSILLVFRSNIANPIGLARILCERQSKLLSMDRIPPMILSGEGALNYAKELNIPIVPHESLISSKARKTYDHYRKNVEKYEQTFSVKVTPLDTVGAVAVDSSGHCVAGCSSGGLILKISGRIGQAATYGGNAVQSFNKILKILIQQLLSFNAAGCWAEKKANKSIATCTTGNGEYLMKTLLAREIVASLKQDPQCSIMSLHKTFKTNFLESPFLRNLDEVYGGALTVVFDSTTGDGEILWSHTTQSFCIGHQTTTQKSPRVSYLFFEWFKTKLCYWSIFFFSLFFQRCLKTRDKVLRPLFKDNILSSHYDAFDTKAISN